MPETRADFIKLPVKLWAPQVAELLDVVGGVAYIAGGAARQLVMREKAPPAEDVDLFLYSAAFYETCHAALARLGYHFAGETESAMSLEARYPGIQLPVQVIRPTRDPYSLTWGEPEQVLDSFSFTTEMFAVTLHEAIVGSRAEEDTAARQLVVNHVTDPVSVALRAAKYTAKGYHMATAEMQLVFDAYAERKALAYSR